MKFSIGDKIVLNRTGEEGVVTGYISTDMLEVEVNGVSFPVYASDIDHPYLKWFTENKKKPAKQTLLNELPVERDVFKKSKLAKGAYLSFLPEFKPDIFEDEVKALKIYLLNELPVPVYFHYKLVNNQQQVLFAHEGKLHEFSHLFLHTIPFELMNEQPRFHWELTDAGNAKYGMETGVLRIKPQKLFEHINTMLRSNEPMFVYLLTDSFKIANEKDDFEFTESYTTKPLVKKLPIANWKDTLPHFEIDLHLENITTHTRGLSSADKLLMQLNALHKHLNAVIANRQERTIIIHGLGKGVLRDEVHKVLREIPQVSKFSNEWQGKYGFGATEVWLKY